jgi:glucokinase-like ROK family protein
VSRDRPILGLDIGGTNLAVGVATADGRIQAHTREASRAHEGPDAMIDRLIQMGRAAVATAGLEVGDLAAVGVGCGGPLDPVRGVVLNALNNPGWIDIPLVERIEQALRRPTYLDNDANAAALAEHRFGAGRGVRNLVYLTISTGVGAGVIVDDRLVHGENGNAGELGHLIVRIDGRPCHCGSRGCVEAYCSGSSIAERAREALSSFDGTSRLASLGQPPRAEDVLDAVRAGDPLAQTIWDETMAVLGAGVVSIIHAFNPRLVLLGGGVTAAGPLLFDPVRRTVSEQAIPALRDVVDIRPAQLGELSGVLGAVAVALDRMSHQATVAVASAADPDPLPGPVDEREWVEHQRIVADTASQLEQIRRTATVVCEALDAGHRLVTFGNGGSAADAQHFAAELLGRFRSTRRPLPAIALTTDPSTMTGIANDFGYEEVFARQVEALVEPGDVVIGLTTSGRSENVVRGLRAARARGATVVAWTGSEPGPAGEAADLVLAVPSSVTARIQEVHALAMHVICTSVDAWAEAVSPGSRHPSGA